MLPEPTHAQMSSIEPILKLCNGTERGTACTQGQGRDLGRTFARGTLTAWPLNFFSFSISGLSMIRNIIKKIYNSFLDMLPDYAAVNFMYFCHFRQLPNLKHPKTLNEKIAWRKLYQCNPQFTSFADKIIVKDEIAKIIGEQHIIETLWTGCDPEEIPFDALTLPYVIKVNHSNGGNIFIRTAKDIERNKIIASLRKQLRFSYHRKFREWAYASIPRSGIVEKMIEMPSGDAPEDYKFFVYHGRSHFIQVDFDRFKAHKRNLYDRDWNLLAARLIYPATAKAISKPVNLDKMIEIAEEIGSNFDFVRVDLYAPAGDILFGEVTFYPGAGIEKFVPQEWDYKFGEPWEIDTSSIFRSE